MKRLMCLIAVLGATLWIESPAQAEFLGTLLRDEGWVLNVDNGSVTGDPGTAVTLHFVRNNREVVIVRTVAPGQRVQFSFPAPLTSDVRIAIDVDSNPGAELSIEVVQGDRAFQLTIPGSRTAVLNVADAADSTS